MEGKTTRTSTTAYLAQLLQSCIDKKAHQTGRLLHARILRIGLFSDTFLSNRLIEFYSKCASISSARTVFDKMPRRDVYSWNAMLGGHCKVKSSLQEDAHILFEQMPERNTVSWNTLISALVRSGNQGKAVDVYRNMSREGFLPTHFTLASVLSAFGGLFDVQQGKRCHGLAVKINLDTNMYVGNALLCMYAKCGIIGDAIQVFENIPNPNEVTFTALMGGLAQTDRVAEAFEMFRFMRTQGILVDSVSLSSILGVCARESGCNDEGDSFFSSNVTGQQVHSLTIRLGFERDLHLSNSLLDMYAKSGDMGSAELLFTNLPEVSVVSWNVMIAGYGQKYQSQKAIEYFQRMLSSGFEPEDVTYINMLAACVKSGDIETGRQMFDSLSCPSLSSWNAILSGYSQIEHHGEAIKLFREMQFRNLQPDRTTLAIILSSSAAIGLLEAGKQLHAASQKAAFHTDIYIASGLIGMYSKCGKMEMAKCIFYRMPALDAVCWNSMIAGFLLNSMDKDAFTFFNRMRQQGMFPTQFSYATVLSSCTKLSSSFQGRQVHAQIAKDGHTNDVYVGSALIDMYCKCGEIDAARMFFDMMPNKNAVTWNEMIHGYAQNGLGDGAVRLYRDMIESSEKPDIVTFVAVLTGCSHSGLVDTAIDIFNSMQQEHGVEPILDHYTCIIDCLGRAGRFHEAELFLEKMPYRNDPVVWEVLLSSCRVHSNASLGKRAAEELFRLDPDNSTPYTLLANIYVSLGRWDEARAVREIMSDKQVVKNPGYSWIEDKNGVQAYVVDDEFKTAEGEAEQLINETLCAS